MFKFYNKKLQNEPIYDKLINQRNKRGNWGTTDHGAAANTAIF